MTQAISTAAERFVPLVTPHIEAALASRPSDPVAPLLRIYPGRGGKMFRPVLCLSTVEALGGDSPVAARMAASLELLHNAFLVHDDLEDGSSLRRGEPSLHTLLGPELAVHVGDALLARAFSNALFAASANRAGLTAMAEIQRAVTATEEGQSLDLLSSQGGPVAATAAQYHRIVLKKSAAYSTVLPLRLGAALAGIAEPNILLRLTRFAMFAGIAFQIQDDLRSFGSSGANGKNPADDLREGKTTLPAVAFSETATRDDRMLLETFAATNRKERSHQQAQLLASRMVASGALDRARRVAYVAAAHAKHEWATMERVMLPGVGRDALAALPEFAITHR